MNIKIMGILNITPDSFYDGGKYVTRAKIQDRIEKMISQGVDIIDVGAFSSRPGALIPTIEEELERLIPVLEVLKGYNTPLSVDTYRLGVVEQVLKYKNVQFINDISGLSDERILPYIKNSHATYILMHTKGQPKNMQNAPVYLDVIGEIYKFFEEKITLLKQSGIDKIFIDPGIGFGKTIDHNYEILSRLDAFRSLKYPILLGLSRKSMIYKLLDTSPDRVLPETVALNLFGLQKGARILRVHDVEEHVNLRNIYEKMQNLS